jgi:cytochrome b561
MLAARKGAVGETAMTGSGGTPRYTAVAQASHWMVAVLFLAAVVLAWIFMGMPATAPGRFFYITLHKSLGQTIFFFALFKLIYRRWHSPPTFDGRVAGWESIIARVNHWLLYSIMIFMPVTGFSQSLRRGHLLTSGCFTGRNRR